MKKNYKKFTCTTDGHNKFWEIWVDEFKLVLFTQWGKIGTTGTINSLNYTTNAEIFNAYNKIIKSKKAKGYVETLEYSYQKEEEAEKPKLKDPLSPKENFYSEYEEKDTFVPSKTLVVCEDGIERNFLHIDTFNSEYFYAVKGIGEVHKSKIFLGSYSKLYEEDYFIWVTKNSLEDIINYKSGKSQNISDGLVVQTLIREDKEVLHVSSNVNIAINKSISLPRSRWVYLLNWLNGTYSFKVEAYKEKVEPIKKTRKFSLVDILDL
jgi:predicted DNA-binding WGR domain protein